MKSRLIATSATLSIVAVGAGIIFPEGRPTITVVWTLAMAAYALLELNSASRSLLSSHSRFDALLKTAIEEPGVPEDLKRMERALGWMSYEPDYFDFRVRPIIKELVEHRLAKQSGEPDKGTVSPVLDPELQTLLGPRKGREIYGTQNLTTVDLSRLVGKIEDL